MVCLTELMLYFSLFIYTLYQRYDCHRWENSGLSSGSCQPYARIGVHPLVAPRTSNVLKMIIQLGTVSMGKPDYSCQSRRSMIDLLLTPMPPFRVCSSTVGNLRTLPKLSSENSSVTSSGKPIVHPHSTLEPPYTMPLPLLRGLVSTSVSRPID